jgi:hypothetical protein
VFDNFTLDHFIRDEKIVCKKWAVPERVGGEWMDVKAVLRIAYSNQKSTGREIA